MGFLTVLGGRAPRLIRKRLSLCGLRLFQCSKFSSDGTHQDDDALYDLIISGGGMVGCAMAAAVAQEPMFKGKRVLLLEAAADKRMNKLPEVYRSRTCALSASSVQLLDQFGAWKNICEMRVQPVDHMQVWDSCSDSMITFHKDLAASDKPLAFIAENDVIMEGISNSLRSLSSDVVQVKYNCRVQGYKLPEPTTGVTKHADEFENQWAQVIMSNGQTLKTRLLIGADGVNSLVRQSSGIHQIKWNYWQTAVVATLTLAKQSGDNTTAWQRFLPSGPIAMLPLTNEHSCLIWSTSHAHAKQLSQMSADSLVDAINHAFQTDDWKDSAAVSVGQLVHSMTSGLGLRSLNYLDRRPRLAPTVAEIATDSIGSFPLGLGHATHYVKPRMALIGDAAHRVHPLAGQGVNLGFGDVNSLVSHLVSGLEIGSDIGSLDHLLSYETERQRVVVPLMAGIDGLNRIYSSRNPLLVLLRSVGCNTLQSLTPAKDFMMKFAAN